MIITIDGPTASGKSSVAQGLAKKLGFHCLSSGMLYRALAYILIEYFGYSLEKVSNPNVQNIYAALDSRRFSYTIDIQGCGQVSFDGKDITPFLKSESISQASSIMATNKGVRDTLDALQRTLAQQFDIVTEGRDMGSVVFPHADVKFFLTASLDERARRWQDVQKKLGAVISLDEAKRQIQERDTRDRERPIAPLIIPKDAIIIDNTHLSLAQTTDLMMKYITKRA
jgi:CMP/dCMP kinase